VATGKIHGVKKQMGEILNFNQGKIDCPKNKKQKQKQKQMQNFIFFIIL